MDSSDSIATSVQNFSPRHRRGSAFFDNERWLGPLLIGPAVLYIMLLVGVPFLMALYYSVSNTTTGGGTMGFVGLRNFTAVIGTPKFQTALKNTIVFGFISQILILILSNALALSLQANFRGKRLIRFFILLPWVAPISIGTIAWLWIFDSTYSVLNWMLRLAGLIHGTGYMWLGLPNLAMGSIIAVHIWRQLPLATVPVRGRLRLARRPAPRRPLGVAAHARKVPAESPSGPAATPSSFIEATSSSE